MSKPLFASTLLAFVLVAACDAEDEETMRRNNKSGGGGDDSAENDPNGPALCPKGTPHVGFGGFDFASERTEGALGADRRRVKPFTALQTEFTRALGQAPAGLAPAAAAFGETPARWYAEPTSGAVSLYTTYSLAFTGCYDMMSGANYQVAPTPEAAKNECTALQRKLWQRSPTPEEAQACVDLATTGLASEGVARRRWAHACASIMTSASFTTY